MFYFQQGQRFVRKFHDYQLIDGSKLWPEKVDSSMQQLYGLIGVNSSFSSGLFKKDFHGLFQRVLEFSGMNIDIFGYKLPVRLGIQDPCKHNRLFPSANLGIAHISKEVAMLG